MSHDLTEIIERLKGYDTPTLANAVETFDVRPRDVGYSRQPLNCMFPDIGPIVGFAATATTTAGDPEVTGFAGDRFAALYEHVMDQPNPRIVVVHDLDLPHQIGTMWGEVNATVFQALGCVGTITDGTVRDLPEVHAMGFQFIAAGPVVSHGYIRLDSVGEKVDICGLTVAPGDLLHADVHGVLTIPAEIVADVAEAADRITAREQRFIQWVRSEDFSPDRLSQVRVQH